MGTNLKRIALLFALLPVVLAGQWHMNFDEDFASVAIGLPDVTDGLVAWWKFDVNANDSVGTNNGTVYGVTNTVIAGKQCYSFEGVAGQRIDLGYAPEIKPRTNITVSVWAYFNELAFNTRIFHDWQSQVNSDRFLFYSERADYIYFYVCREGELNTGIVSTPVSLSSWIHFVGTYDGEKVRLYVNGSQIGAGSDLTGLMNEAVNGANTSAGSQFNSGYTLNGYLREARIYNRALSGNEITTIYNKFK